MEYQTVIVLYHHGQDDYAVWITDLPTEMVRESETICCAGDSLADIIKQVPLVDEAENTLYLLSHQEEEFSLLKKETAPEFLEHYSRYGCSLRGTEEQVIDEILDGCQSHGFDLSMA